MKILTQELFVPYEKFGICGEGLSPRLTCMLHDSSPDREYPAAIAVPGGSYTRCSKREGEPAAARLYSYGFNTFLLEYSCVNKKFPTALAELAAAASFIRQNREILGCTVSLAVYGFSAGGHLAATLGAYAKKLSPVFGNVRPDVLVLSYPVITSGEYSHRQSVENIAPDEQLREKISVERLITADFPPSFIWHCADDTVVDVKNSLLLASSLSENNIPFELHIFPEGGHGIALCDETTMKDNDPRYINPHAARWFPLSLSFVKKYIKTLF